MKLIQVIGFVVIGNGISKASLFMNEENTLFVLKPNGDLVKFDKEDHIIYHDSVASRL